MVIRRCPQCHSTCDDRYGFCIKCGCEFPNASNAKNVCPLCNYTNPDEADYCVKCGTPLIFKNQFENNESSIKPIIIQKSFSNNSLNYNDTPHTSRLLILFGYIFSILGGIIGLIIAIYLATRKDPVAKKHGRIQLGIFAFYFILILYFVATGAITMENVNQVMQMYDLTNLTNTTL